MLSGWLVSVSILICPGYSADTGALEIRDRFYWERSLQRVGSRETAHLWVERPVALESWTVAATLLVPDGVQIHSPAQQERSTWSRLRVFTTRRSNDGQPGFVDAPVEHVAFSWIVEADEPVVSPLTVMYTLPDGSMATAVLAVDFQPPINTTPQSYVPEPIPAESRYHIGGIYFPGWKPGAHWGWSILDAYPERRPALGYYDESDPEVMDWQIKWAVEHGINFFMFCWYREYGNLGQPVQTRLAHALHDGFFHARYADRIRFAIMWENQAGAGPGVADREDLMNHLLTNWMTYYFTHPSYLVVDNKPVLFIYDVHNLIRDLGSEVEVKDAMDAMRNVAKGNGFDGLYLIAEYRGNERQVLEQIKACGLDYTFAYCFHGIPPDADQAAIVRTLGDIHKQRFSRREVLPDIATIAVGWRPEPWETYANYPSSLHWWLKPEGYRQQAAFLRKMMAEQSSDSLSSRMVMLDNLNEWGEGHYIMPHREFGFRYLEAIRNVYTDASTPHRNILPEEIGLGPYDAAHARWIEQMAERFGTSQQE